MADALEPNRITTLEQLDDLMAASSKIDVWMFKHSLICPTSDVAWSEFERFSTRTAPGEATAVVEIQRAREVSRAVEARTGIRHESPQVLLIRDGEAIWNASHWAITEQTLEAAAARHSVAAVAGSA